MALPNWNCDSPKLQQDVNKQFGCHGFFSVDIYCIDPGARGLALGFPPEILDHHGMDGALGQIPP